METVYRPINGYRAMKIAFDYGISKTEVVEAMKNREFPYSEGMLDGNDPETLLDEDTESYFRADEQDFREWCIARVNQRLDPDNVQKMFAQIQVSIGYLRRDIAQIRWERLNKFT